MSYPGSGAFDELFGMYYLMRLPGGRVRVLLRQPTELSAAGGRPVLGPLSWAIMVAHCVAGTGLTADDWQRAGMRASAWHPAFNGVS